MDKIKKLDEVFSEFIRLRDSKPYGFKAFKCISCGRVLPFSMADCGHFVKRSNQATRWDEENCHAQCIDCNRFRDGSYDAFSRSLVIRLGQDKVEELIQRGHQTVKFSKSEIDEKIRYYKEQIKELKK